MTDGAPEPPSGSEPAAAVEHGERSDDEPSTSTGGSGSRRGWSRPVAALATAALTVTLGFALTVQIRSTAEPEDQDVRREQDLVLILDELNAREEELRRQIGTTRQTVDELSSGQEQSGGALEEARSRAEAIGILAGTLPATGPGLRITINDADGAVPASVILGLIQELRGAGAEALQIDGVRVIVSSAVTGTPGDLRIDGEPLSAPYDVRVVGPPAAMAVALEVSGGIVADVGRVGGKAVVEQVDVVTVDATVD
ncbi:DUF881 domain-containing protein [Blastococcus sp. SYSU DS0539]